LADAFEVELTEPVSFFFLISSSASTIQRRFCPLDSALYGFSSIFNPLKKFIEMTTLNLIIIEMIWKICIVNHHMLYMRLIPFSTTA